MSKKVQAANVSKKVQAASMLRPSCSGLCAACRSWLANDRCGEQMKLTGETKGLALVLDTAPLKARRWSRLKVSRPPTFLTCVRLAHTL